MDVLDLAVIAEFVNDVFFRRFFVDIGDEKDPTFDRSLRSILAAGLLEVNGGKSHANLHKEGKCFNRMVVQNLQRQFNSLLFCQSRSIIFGYIRSDGDIAHCIGC